MSSNKAAIILVNWNDYETTKECVQSINNTVTQDVEIIVVDNESTNPQKIHKL